MPELQRPVPVHRRFERWAAADPGRTAITDAAVSLSYGELDRRANRIAHRLLASGAADGGPIGVAADRGIGLVTALLGVLKTGSGYVPLDPAHPRERLRHIGSECRLRLVLGENHHRGLAADTGARFLDLDDAANSEAPERAPDITPDPDSAMYVIHTSGSTGAPKGVVVTHANVARLFSATRDSLRIAETDVWSAFHSYAFDFSVWETWGALAHGGRLVTVPYEVSRDPETFWELLRRERVTVLNQTPSAFLRLLAAARRSGFPATSLRLVVFGGEELRPPTLRPWLEGYPDHAPELVNMYGITETTVHVTLRRVREADVASPDSPIGTPLDDLELHLLGPDLGPVGPSDTGELYVGGAGLARGYLRRPGLTAERFVPNPYGPPGSRLYRTGDLARRRQDGELVFLGRADRQVQLRGFRIEPGEVEAALRNHSEVDQAAAVVRDDGHGEPMLVGYVVPSDGTAPDPAAVRARVSELLPPQLVPTWIVALDTLPLTAQGKLDEEALPAPEGSRGGGPAGVGREDRPDELLASLAAEVLELPRLDPEQNFFARGGDSIRAVRLVARARELGLSFTVADLYRAPVLRQLAERAVPAEQAAPAEETGTAEETAAPWETDSGVRPASHAQLGMLYECELHDDPTLYRVLAAVRLRGTPRPNELRAALDHVSARHEVLNSHFDQAEDGLPVQRILAGTRIPLSVWPSGSPKDDALTDVVEHWRHHWAEHVRADHAPPLHCHVLPHDDGTYHLALVVHHALLDGWSIATLGTELLHTYRAHLEGSEPALPAPVGTGCREHVRAERRAKEDPGSRSFWRRHLRRVVPGPPPGPPHTDAGEEAGTPRVTLPSGTTEALRRTARELSVPVKSLYLAAQLWARAALTEHATPVVGLAFHLRPETSAGDRALGMFLNILPITTGMSEGTRWPDLVHSAFDQERHLLPYRGMPLSELVSWRGGPLFDTVFNYTDFHVLRSEEDNLPRQEWYFDNPTTFPLFVEVQHGPVHAATSLTTRAGIGHSTAVAKRSQRLMLRALTSLAEEPDATVPSLTGTEETERTRSGR
ncbi:non-ribosomal peptide synthetase [Actinopolyspora erythraea]|uniref:Non-ribosomal peptide synthetase n=1 Tax=Actinopolyspora erythraea TaxID=414996 RepID=A0A223RX15_9ACTN|nr:non-ribosomal peptide synthetase [Actinopolyspora erythraea]ASU80421.1 non-ribosomal peptide synthetase [Actinopolyspora erythraea]